MDCTTEKSYNSSRKKDPFAKTKKPIKSSKSFLSQASNPATTFKSTKTSSKNSRITPVKARPSLYKENFTTKDSDSFAQISRLNPSRQSVLKKKPSKTKTPRVKSLNANKRASLKDQRPNSRLSLKTQSSTTTLKILDMNKKLTPRSSHPSPQHSHRTPDSIKISQNLPNLTEKKQKIPEVGYYCKRFALFDKSKPLYKEEENRLKDEFPKLDFDIPFTFAEDLTEKEEFKSPKRVIKVYSSPGKIESGFDRNEQPRAPRKGLSDFDSPGSFIYSLSSNSSEEKICRKIAKKDEESQTDLIELIGDCKVVEGLKLIGRLSEILNRG